MFAPVAQSYEVHGLGSYGERQWDPRLSLEIQETFFIRGVPAYPRVSDSTPQSAPLCRLNGHYQPLAADSDKSLPDSEICVTLRYVDIP
ncbi:Ribitol-5-phosphate cytidylyltransferase, partial [Frankliniella fusca]